MERFNKKISIVQLGQITYFSQTELIRLYGYFKKIQGGFYSSDKTEEKQYLRELIYIVKQINSRDEVVIRIRNEDENNLEKMFKKSEENYRIDNTYKLIFFLDDLFLNELGLKEIDDDDSYDDEKEFFHCRDSGKY